MGGCTVSLASRRTPAPCCEMGEGNGAIMDGPAPGPVPAPTPMPDMDGPDVDA
ncbi:hypothetical protein BGZ58_001968, partial [Dissophora ornata]